MSDEMSVDAEGMNRVKRRSSFVAKSEGFGSASPGVGHRVWTQSLLGVSPGMSVWQSVMAVHETDATESPSGWSSWKASPSPVKMYSSITKTARSSGLSTSLAVVLAADQRLSILKKRRSLSALRTDHRLMFSEVEPVLWTSTQSSVGSMESSLQYGRTSVMASEVEPL